MRYKFIISGGGTGGHIYPAIAIADELKKQFPNAEILFVGASGRMEMQKIPEAGYKIEGLPIIGLSRKFSLDLLKFPFLTLKSLSKSYKILKNFNPDMVIGTGGFASAPILKMAQLLGIPYVIQEQNSFAGVANKWVGKGAAKIFVAYPDMQKFFPAQRLVLSGNPVRENLLTSSVSKEKALAHFGLSPEKKTLLVLGGSLGARAINQLIEENLTFFNSKNIQIIWQCGKFYASTYEKYNSLTVKVLAFIKEMQMAYAAADFIISRAGAGAVSELCLVGKPVIFIPSPNVANDHQSKNADAIVAQNAAIVVKEEDLKKRFLPEFEALINSKNQQKELSQNIQKLAQPKATSHIVSEIEKILTSQKQ